MPDATTLLSSAGISFLMLVAAFWVAKLWVKEQIVQSVTHEYNIRRIRFESLHLKVAEVIEGTYARLIRLRVAVADYVSILESSAGPSKEDRRSVAGKRLSRLKGYFETRRIYLPEDTARKIDSLINTLYETVLDFMVKVEHAIEPHSDDQAQAWSNAHRTIADTIPPILADLAEEFRLLLGYEDK